MRQPTRFQVLAAAGHFAITRTRAGADKTADALGVRRSARARTRLMFGVAVPAQRADEIRSRLVSMTCSADHDAGIGIAVRQRRRSPRPDCSPAPACCHRHARACVVRGLSHADSGTGHRSGRGFAQFGSWVSGRSMRDRATGEGARRGTLHRRAAGTATLD